MNETELENSDLPLNERLLQTRKKLNLTLNEVADHLNLRAAQLAKLEQPEIDYKGCSAFERGYIRNYAQYLKVDISQFTAELEEDDRSGNPLKSMNRFNYLAPKPIFINGFVKGALVVVLIFLIGLWAILMM